MSLPEMSLSASAGLSLSTGVLGLFMAVPLMTLQRRRASNLWLGLFVLSLALLCLADFVEESGLGRRYHRFYGLFDWPVAALGSFYYCYVRSILGLGNSWRQAWLFLPLAAWLGILLHLFARGPVGFSLGPAMLFFQLLACACAVAVLYRLHQYRQALHERFSSTKGRDFIWVSWVTVMMLALLAVWLPANLYKGIWEWPLVLGRLAVLFLLGWYGMHQPGVFNAAAEPEAAAPPAPAGAPPIDQGPLHEHAPQALLEQEQGQQQGAALGLEQQHEAGAAKYARSGMTDAAQQLIGERLDRRMSGQRDFLDSDIKLGELAARIGTSPQLLSQYLNDVLGMNFFDYINGLRVAEVQKMMGDAALAERPLLDLAYAAGFNSRSTFNAAFKKVSGMAPSRWRKQCEDMSEPFG